MDKKLKTAIMESLAETRPKIGDDFWTEFIQRPADELYRYHFGLGLYLRNNLLAPESELYKLFMLAGIGHKDDMSSMMMKQWHKVLNGRPETGCAGHEQIQDYVWRVTKMKSTGFTRAIDELGRFVLPAEVRAKFDLKEKDTLEVFTDEGGIYLKPYDTKHCVFCTDKDNLIPHGNKYICGTCLTAINGQAAGK